MLVSTLRQRRSFKDILLESYTHHTNNFVDKTSMHGVKQVHLRRCGSPKQIFWIIMISLCIAAASYQGQKQFRKFLSLPSQTDIKLESLSKGFTFPDVTFCDPLSSMTSDSISSINGDPNMDKASLIRKTKLSDLIIETILEDTYMNMSELDRTKAKLMPQEHFINITGMYPQPLDRIILCKYNGEDCDFSNFITSYDRDFHNCYTFHSDIAPRTGDNFGLLVLFLVPSFKSSEWAENIVTINDMTAAGLTVEIKEPNTRSQPLQKGYFLPLNVKSDIEVTQSMMDIQYGSNLYYNCEPPSTMTYFDLQYSQSVNYQTRLGDCTNKEYLEKLYEKCGCYPEDSLPVSLVNFKGGPTLQYCSDIMETFLTNDAVDSMNSLNDEEKIARINSILNTEKGRKVADQIRCLWKNYKSFAQRDTYNTETNCKSSCTYKFYDNNVIQSQWLGAKNFRHISSKTQMMLLAESIARYFKSLKIDAKNLTQSNNNNVQLLKIFNDANVTNVEDILNSCQKDSWNDTKCSILMKIASENMALVNVFAASDTSMNYYFVLSYDVHDMMSDVGGIYSLAIGFSILTVVEMVELLLRLFFAVIRSSFKKSVEMQKENNIPNKRNKTKQMESDENFSSDWI